MNALAPSFHECSPASAGEIMEAVLLKGDLASLTPDERVAYYNTVCQTIGVEPMTKPFAYITLNGALTLYALKACTDQLRKKHGISIAIVSREIEEHILTVHVKATNAENRADEDLGTVYMCYPAQHKVRGNLVPHPKAGKPLEAEDRANAILKAVTKAKRRVTLSICGLGMLDETEVEDIPAAAKREVSTPAECEVVDRLKPTETQVNMSSEPQKQAISSTASAPPPAAAPTRQRQKPGPKPKKPPRDLTDTDYETEIASSQPRRAFDRQAPLNPDEERRAWEAEERAHEFIRLEHEIQCIPTLEALQRWGDDHASQFAKYTEGELNPLRRTFANKKLSLQPHSIARKAMEARPPRFVRPDDGLDIPQYLRRSPSPHQEAAE
jgi:hypothetical protein